MRKRLQHTRPKSKTRVPAIIVMSIALVCILGFGKDFSKKMAIVFEPSVPVTDAPVAVQDGPHVASTQTQAPAGPTKTGTIVSQAYKNAAQSMLKVISNTP